MIPERFYQDDFSVMLRRQGWHLIQCKPPYTDPAVIAIRLTESPHNIATGDRAFHEFLGDTIVRKLLRAILARPRTRQELLRSCSNEQKLDQVVAILEQDGLITRELETWKKGPECRTIDNIGPTLEWYVAEWFRSQLQVPARHGVLLEEVAQWGDLDVVAFVNDVRVMVECKSAKPDDIPEAELRHFLQRAATFNPEIAVLLIDTESPILKPIEILNAIYPELAWQDSQLSTPSLSENAQIDVPRIEPQPDFKGLYWGARNIYVTSVQRSIDASLSAVLRLYHARIRHLSFVGGTNIWNFVAGTVSKLEEP
jgi:hypothetical protein